MLLTAVILVLPLYALLLWAGFSRDSWSQWSEVPRLCTAWWAGILRDAAGMLRRAAVWVSVALLAALAMAGFYSLGRFFHPSPWIVIIFLLVALMSILPVTAVASSRSVR